MTYTSADIKTLRILEDDDSLTGEVGSRTIQKFNEIVKVLNPDRANALVYEISDINKWLKSDKQSAVYAKFINLKEEEVKFICEYFILQDLKSSKKMVSTKCDNARMSLNNSTVGQRFLHTQRNHQFLTGGSLGLFVAALTCWLAGLGATAIGGLIFLIPGVLILTALLTFYVVSNVRQKHVLQDSYAASNKELLALSTQISSQENVVRQLVKAAPPIAPPQDKQIQAVTRPQLGTPSTCVQRDVPISTSTPTPIPNTEEANPQSGVESRPLDFS